MKFCIDKYVVQEK